MRVTGKPNPLKNVTRTCGSVATFASLTILPAASTTHTLDCSKDTSIPASYCIGCLPELRCLGPTLNSLDPVSHPIGRQPLSPHALTQGPLRHLVRPPVCAPARRLVILGVLQGPDAEFGRTRVLGAAAIDGDTAITAGARSPPRRPRELPHCAGNFRCDRRAIAQSEMAF